MTKVAISELAYYPGNARKGDHDLIEDSLKRFGQYRPVTVNKGTRSQSGLTNVILVGNNTVRVASERLSWDKVDVHWVDVDDGTAAKINVLDNRANDKSTYDLLALVEQLNDMPDLDGTGFTDAEFESLRDSLQPNEPDIPDEEKPLGTAVISYNLIFDDEQQQDVWFEFTKWLKRTYSDKDTVAERLTEYLEATAGERG